MKFLKFVKINKDTTYHQSLKVDAQTESILLTKEKIALRLSSCTIRKYISPIRYYRCQRYGGLPQVAKTHKKIHEVCCE